MNPTRLACPIKHYAWGSRTFIAALQGRSVPAPEPEAELWIGAHRGAPATALDAEPKASLADLIHADPSHALGSQVSREFEGELPFLLKVLSAAAPLSLQAHPSAEQARIGYAAEQARGVPLASPERSYKDPRPKPELIAALTPFYAFTGFRKVTESRRLFDELGVAELGPFVAPLAHEPPQRALRAVFEGLMTASPEQKSALAERAGAAFRQRAQQKSEFQSEFGWAARLAQLYPGDIGAVAAMLLNLVRLEPFEALYLPAGNLHSYLEGSGVEIMASSDNVLRGGLSSKPLNLRELLRVLVFDEFAPMPLRARPLEGNPELAYLTPAREFCLSYAHVEGKSALTPSSGPELVLVTSGVLEIERAGSTLRLASGEAAFLPAPQQTTQLAARGKGTLFRAVVAQGA